MTVLGSGSGHTPPLQQVEWHLQHRRGEVREYLHMHAFMQSSGVTAAI